jgi:FAD-linked sulfhydryl oxidase
MKQENNNLTHFRLCHVHNQVNQRLGKPEFDCAHLDETYDCGCGDDPLSLETTATAGVGAGAAGVDDLTGVGMIKGGR